MLVFISLEGSGDMADWVGGGTACHEATARGYATMVACTLSFLEDTVCHHRSITRKSDSASANMRTNHSLYSVGKDIAMEIKVTRRTAHRSSFLTPGHQVPRMGSRFVPSTYELLSCVFLIGTRKPADKGSINRSRDVRDGVHQRRGTGEP